MALEAPVQPGDQAARAQALDTAQSFLVQAPAGSGKTELLTDRILALLSVVQRPEEIVALTFTRKAATEMHERVLSKLRAALAPPPQECFRRHSWELARAALCRDTEQGWQLLQQPARLGIRTLDAYCASLVRTMPWLSALGGMPQVADDAKLHYQAAARATLAMVDEEPAVATLLAHLDVNLRAAESLIATMLESRDQWLPLLQQGEDVQALVDHLHAAVQHDLHSLAQAMPPLWASNIGQALRHAAQTLAESEPAHPVCALADWDGQPFPADPAALPHWKALAYALLSDKNLPRKTVNRKQGFVPDSPYKLPFVQWLTGLSPDEPWIALLGHARTLPAGYDEAQLDTLRVLLHVLRLAAAQLLLRFGAQGEVDFIEVAQRAAYALGHVDDPSDLLLKLDARVQHILVDEFQDTSQTQIDLLLKLTAGWQPGDGRTLFLVGDPMQSIYRFRKAEVGWFLRVKAQGLGALSLTSLTLHTNFRSRAGVVDWVNTVFQPLFPAHDNAMLGAIRYTPSQAFQREDKAAAVQWHPVWVGQEDTASDRAQADPAEGSAEQALLVALARDALTRHPDSAHPVAILVRARTHVRGVTRYLAQAGLPWRAVDLEPLHQRQVVSDLVQLIRALSHAGDRLAWLSLLRSPLCGLRLTSLYAIAGEDHTTTVPALLYRWLQRGGYGGLASDEAQRLQHAAAVLLDTRNAAGAIPFAAWVAQCWRRLGGALAYPDAQDQADVAQVLRLVETLAPFGNLDVAVFESRLETLYAASNGAQSAVEVMTIHKSKGLEFDTVILAGLHRPPRSDQAPLVYFEHNEGALLLGPIAQRYGDPAPDPVSVYLGQRERQRSRYEEDRVLYVAATRARDTLHLVSEVRVDTAGNPCPPASGSPLARLWDALQTPPPEMLPTVPVRAQTPQPRLLARLPLDALNPAAVPVLTPVKQVWRWQADESVLDRLTGIVAHSWLERLGGEDLAVWDAAHVGQQAGVVRRQLSRSGLPAGLLDAGVQIVIETLLGALGSTRGRWLLGLAQARREWELLDSTGRVSIIDLAVHDAQGWLVVDYKTGVPSPGEAHEDFEARMRGRYQEQLLRYCAQVHALDGRPVRGALYFPRANLWLTYNPQQAA